MSGLERTLAWGLTPARSGAPGPREAPIRKKTLTGSRSQDRFLAPQSAFLDKRFDNALELAKVFGTVIGQSAVDSTYFSFIQISHQKKFR